jgi:hypothetical protein
MSKRLVKAAWVFLASALAANCGGESDSSPGTGNPGAGGSDSGAGGATGGSDSGGSGGSGVGGSGVGGSGVGGSSAAGNGGVGGSGGTGGDADAGGTDDIETRWKNMMDLSRRTLQDIEDWYEQYTGFDGDAYTLHGYSDDLGARNLVLSDLTPSSSITTSQDGQVIERMHVTGRVVIQHQDVVVRGCRIDSTTSSQNGLDIASGAHNATVEYNTFHGPGSGTGADRAIWVNASGAAVGFNRLDGQHGSGIQIQGSSSGGGLLQYNLVSGVRRYPDSHNTSTTFCATRGNRSVYRRNFIRDGTSATMSLYPQDWCGGAIDNLYVEENIIEVCCQNLWYFINSGGRTRPDWSPITRTEFRRNVFIPGLNPQGAQRRPFGDEGGPFVEFETAEGNVWSDNEFLDGTEAAL